MTRARGYVVSLLFCGLTLGPTSARAAEPAGDRASPEHPTTEPPFAEDKAGTAGSARRAEARARYQEGSRLASEQRWAEALEAYNRAWELHPSASTLYNIGFCEARLGRLLRAWTLISRAIALRGGLSAERLALALAERERLRRRLPTLVVSGEAEPELRLAGWDIVPVEGEADTFVVEPGVVGGWLRLRPGSRVYLGPGTYEVEARRAGLVIAKQQLELAEGASLRFPDATEPAAAPPEPSTEAPAPPATAAPGATLAARTRPQPAPPSQQPAPRSTEPSLRVAGFASLAVGGVGLTTAFVSMGVLWQAQARLEEECPSPTWCPVEQQGTVNRYRTAATVSNIGLIGGTAAAALGVGLLLLSRSASGTSTSVALSPAGVHFQRSF